MDIETKKKLAKNWFLILRDIICIEIENLENEFSKNKKKFKTTRWQRSNVDNKGGGEYKILKNGKIFEKVGVNFSEVYGEFDKKFKNQIPGTSKSSKFWASGISVVMHMQNPKIPAMHFNTRFINTDHCWFGGGMDLTPSYKDNNENNWFHNELKSVCDKHNKKYYPKFKKACDEYFYLKHRNEKRGIGGIFFDYKKDNWINDYLFIKDIGNTFTFIFKTIIKKKMLKKWTKNEKEAQLIKRGRYVEFNLLYDRGTRFGLNTDGNTEAILMSLPPKAKWK